jgi:large subunit ribosomal protein L18
MKLIKRERREKRKKRIRAKIFGTKERPRLSVFRSNKHIYCQLIDDEKGHTLTSASDRELKSLKVKNRVEIAFEVGKLIAKKAKKLGIEKVVFDRAGYKYHGRVKALAEGAREGGLKF